MSETVLTVERYAIYWVDLNPVRGSELAKLRPAVVVSDNAMNSALETVVICPMTTRLHPSWPSRVRVDLPDKVGEIAVDQIRTISRSRITGRLGQLSADAAAELRHVITEMYGVLSVSEDDVSRES